MTKKKELSQVLAVGLDKRTQSFNEIERAILLSFDRVGLAPENVDSIRNIAVDLKSRFPDLSDETLIAATKEGSAGVYGRTYRMSYQEVCLWVEKYRTTHREKKLRLSDYHIPREEMYGRSEKELIERAARGEYPKYTGK